MKDCKFVLLFLMVHFAVINSFFDPKDSKQYYYNESLKVNEIRFDFVPEYYYDECSLPEMNHPDKTKKWTDKFYYFQKRLTDRSKDPSLPKYQFVVSSTSEFGTNTGKPNEVTSELGSVFCEMSMMGRVAKIPSTAKNCGIERLLTYICLDDVDVNPDAGYDNQNNKKFNLNLDKIFEGAPEDRLTAVKMTCDRLVGMERIELPWDGIQLPSVPKKLRANIIMKPYISGAIRAGFRFVVWNLKNNGSNGEWQFYHIPIPKTGFIIDQFNTDAPKTKRIWYFC